MLMEYWDGESWSQIDTEGPSVVVAYDINVMICSKRTVEVMLLMNDCLLPSIRLITSIPDKITIQKMHENWRRRERALLVRDTGVQGLSLRPRNSRSGR